MTGDITREWPGKACKSEWKRAAQGLAENQQGKTLQALSEAEQHLFGKMVEDQAPDAGASLNIRKSLEEITPLPLNFRREAGGARREVESDHRSARQGPVHGATESTIPCPKLDDSLAQRGLLLQLSEDPAGISKKSIDESKISPTADRPRICGFKTIENLGRENTGAVRHGA